MTKEERYQSRAAKIAAYQESGAALSHSNIFGLPFSVEESEVVLIPIPWEVTVSFRPGTAKGPEAIRAASHQVDLYDPATPDAWKYGFAMERVDRHFVEQAQILRGLALDCIESQQHGHSLEHPAIADKLAGVNQGGLNLNRKISGKSLSHLREDKIVGIVGGDHSVPFGLMHALSVHHGSYGVLHVDAHYDHRRAYEGFTSSHASIMRNASRICGIEKFVHVGIRDYCKEEVEFVKWLPNRFHSFTDRDLSSAEFNGIGWQAQCEHMTSLLPDRVYVSFDIDGLDPMLCPDTGTPVPGGLSFQKACFLLEEITQSGRTIIGFDLCEVAPKPGYEDLAADWNASVGSRILYKLCSLAATSTFGQWQD